MFSFRIIVWKPPHDTTTDSATGGERDGVNRLKQWKGKKGVADGEKVGKEGGGDLKSLQTPKITDYYFRAAKKYQSYCEL